MNSFRGRFVPSFLVQLDTLKVARGPTRGSKKNDLIRLLNLLVAADFILA